jgi:hypothetical protein
MGLGRNEWHFLSFVGTQLSASRASSAPRTTPLAPVPNICKQKFINPDKPNALDHTDKEMAPKRRDIFKDGREGVIKHFFVQSLMQTKQRTVVTDMIWLDQSAFTS